MEMTAIEWLYDKIKHGITKKQFDEFILRSKEMEKQHIVKAAASAYEDMFGTDGTEYGEKYYEKLTQDDK
jgi:hypothetical protein